MTIIPPISSSLISGAVHLVKNLYPPIISTLKKNRFESPLFRFTHEIVRDDPQATLLTHTLFERMAYKINSNPNIIGIANNGIALTDSKPHAFIHVLNHEASLFSKNEIHYPVNFSVPHEMKQEMVEEAEGIFQKTLQYLQLTPSSESALHVVLPNRGPNSTDAILHDTLFKQVAARLNTLPNGNYFAHSTVQSIHSITTISLLFTFIKN